MLPPGAQLVSPKRRHQASVAADGSLVIGKARGSIHQMGAKLEGQESCNGWTYWHMDVEGSLVPIDALRTQIRQEMAQA